MSNAARHVFGGPGKETVAAKNSRIKKEEVIKIMKNYLILTVIVVCWVAPACSNKTGVPVELSKACALENDKKYVEVNGFLDDKGGVFCSNIGGRMECRFTLKENPQDNDGINVYIEQGTWANNVEKLEKSYKREDIKIHVDDGNLINLSEKVKLTGEIGMMPDGRGCSLKVTKIEK